MTEQGKSCENCKEGNNKKIFGNNTDCDTCISFCHWQPLPKEQGNSCDNCGNRPCHSQEAYGLHCCIHWQPLPKAENEEAELEKIIESNAKEPTTCGEIRWAAWGKKNLIKEILTWHNSQCKSCRGRK